MANIKSAIRRIATNNRNHVRNVAVRSDIKTVVKNTREAAGGETAASNMKMAQKHLAKAASKGVIHKRQAARRTARLARHLSAKVAAAV